MGKPFQFSMRSMLVVMAVFCAEAWMFSKICNTDAASRHKLFGLGLGMVVAGSLLGLLFGCLSARPFTGAGRGAIVAAVLFNLLLFMATLLPPVY